MAMSNGTLAFATSGTSKNETNYEVIEGGGNAESTVSEKETMDPGLNIGEQAGYYALLFAIYGRMVEESGMECDDVFQFPIDATAAINIYFGDKMDKTNSYKAVADINDDGEEFFRDIDELNKQTEAYFDHKKIGGRQGSIDAFF